MGVIVNFNAGELTPKLRYRCDLDKYQNGAARLENFTVMPQGGLENRPGLEYIAEAKSSVAPVRLIPFEFSATDTAILEFGAQYIRIRKSDGTLLQDVVTPYSSENLRGLRYTQMGDIVFLVHRFYPPARLMRYGSTDWRYEAISWKFAAYKDEESGIDLTPSGTTGNITLTASEAIFDVRCDDMLMHIKHPKQSSSLYHEFEDNGESDTIAAGGDWTLKTTGGWHGRLKLMRSFDNGETWIEYRSYVSAQDVNVDSEGTEARENVLYKMVMENWSTPESGVSYKCSATLTMKKYWIDGIVKLHRTNGKTDTVTASVIQELGGTGKTQDFAFSSWNGQDGYPACVNFYNDRLGFANTKAQPQTVWMSKVGDYYNFEQGDNADDALVITLQSAEVNSISWMIPYRTIMIGTKSAEGILSPVDSSEPLSASNRQYESKTAFGSSDLPAFLVNDCIVFLQRGGEHLRELSYDAVTEWYNAPDMTLLAEHILVGGALETAFRSLPFPCIYFVRGDGQLIGFTYERSQNVHAWHRYITAGAFESVAVVSNDQTDEVWVSVKRGEKRYIERFFRRDITDVTDSMFLDCASYGTSGLERFAGKTVSVLADGKWFENLEVTAAGTVMLPITAEKVLVGLPYVSRYESMPIEYVSQGATTGLKKKANKVILKYRDSLGGRAGFSTSDLEQIDQRKTYHQMNHVPPLQTGSYTMRVGTEFTDEESVIVEQNAPYPLSLLGIVHNLTVS